MRASDADREAAASLLNEAFAEGRLTADEHDQRLGAAYAARSWQQLQQLTADLLPSRAPQRSRWHPGCSPGRTRACCVCC
jgi:hypothetical protein